MTPSSSPQRFNTRGRFGRWAARTALLSLLFSACATGHVGDNVGNVGGPFAVGSGTDGGTGQTAGDAAAVPSASSPAAVGTEGVGAPPGVLARTAGDATSAGPPCEVGPVPARFDLERFYTQACVVDGLPVVASAEVDGASLQAAGAIIEGMLANRPDLARRMADRGFRLGVIGVDQRAVDLPEYRDLPTSYPDTDWDAARAYGATPRRPLAAAPEENLLCSAEDTYPGQSVLTHELGHSVLDMAVLPDDPDFADRLRAAFDVAKRMPVYRDTYAMTNADEYWAEGVQDYFDASRPGYGAGGGGDGYDGPIFNRETLREQDPVLFALIVEVFTDVEFSPSCPLAG